MNVLFVQPVVPHYRVPFFRELNQRAGLTVKVWSDHHSAGSIQHADPDGAFDVGHWPERKVGAFISQPAYVAAVRDPWPDVVVLGWNTRYLQLTQALAEARLRGRPVVLWGHGYSKNEHPLRRAIRNALGKRACACVTYSEHTSQGLVAAGFSAERVFTAANAIDGAPMQRLRERWLSDPEGLRAMQAKHGVSTDRLILFVSRIEPDKRVDVLLHAFKYTLEQVPSAQLMIVGGGSQHGVMRQLAKTLGLADHVRFTGPLYGEEELAALFVSARAFAYPVAIGLSLLHAFNYAVPVITSDNKPSHNPEFEVLRSEVNGLVYHDGDCQHFAGQLARTLTDDSLHARLSAAALSSVSPPRGRTLSQMADGMERAIRYAATQMGR